VRVSDLIGRAHAENEEKQHAEVLDISSVFDEWRGLFTLYRNNGYLPEVDRARFRYLSKELRRKGIIKDRDINNLLEEFGE
jgi:sulfite reductase beta subunit-like hemoprotein